MFASAQPALGQTTDEVLKPCEFVAGMKVVSSKRINLPEPGTAAEVEVGQTMVSAMLADVLDQGMVLKRPLTIKGKYALIDYDLSIPAGAVPKVGNEYRPTGYTLKYASESRPRTAGGRGNLTFVPDASASPTYHANLSFGFSSTKFPIDPADIEFRKCSSLGPEGFRRELLYSGVSKGTVSLQYREFSHNMARPAFSQELKYDLAEGDEIGFRGARFKILKATNASVKYIVLKPLE